jgi:hypothetical protein
MSTIEELLEGKSIGSGLERQDYGHRGSVALAMRHPSIHKSWHNSVGIVRSRTQSTEFVVCLLLYCNTSVQDRASSEVFIGIPLTFLTVVMLLLMAGNYTNLHESIFFGLTNIGVPRAEDWPCYYLPFVYLERSTEK